MATSNIDITQMNAIPYISHDNCSLTPTVSSGLTLTAKQQASPLLQKITSLNAGPAAGHAISPVFYNNSAENTLIVDGEVTIQGTCVLKELQLQTLQIEALTDIIEEMLKEKRFDIEFDLEKRVEQKLFIKKLSSK